MKPFRLLAAILSLAAGLLGTNLKAAQITNVISGTLTGTNTWYHTNLYIMSGPVYVLTNSVLNIEAGTVIKGRTNATPATISALFICQGGKVYANGTASSPIIFTSELDDVDDPFDLSIYQRGLWGGVVIFGKASINTASDTTGNATTPKYDVYEGLSDAQIGGQFVHRFGGADDDDNSGVFRYVSIRHGGKVLESNKEINGLSLGGVGRGTTIEYVEAYAIADDGFEFFGGTVNTKHLVSAFNDDDAFDMDQGHRGKHQFWFGIQEPGARDNGFELNGEPVGLVFTNTPLGKFTIYNATVIGAGSSSGVANNGFNVRDRASPNIRNAVFTEFGQRGLNVSANCQPLIDSGDLTFKNTFWWNFGNVANPNSVTNLAIASSAQLFFTNTTYGNSIVDPQLRSISRSQNGGLDPRPKTTSPVFTNYTAAPNDGFFSTANYAGAFDANDLWIAGWTALSQYGLIMPRTNVVDVTGTLTGTNNWYRTNVYYLNGPVYVLTNGVLNIEAGTVVKGKTNATPATISALFICQGGKIFANGTANSPIIFTSELDDVDDPFDLSIYQRGLWGGVVIFGKASINTASDTTGNSTSPKYDVYEGLSDAQISGQFVHRFGGADDDDNSGVFRYVSIRHGGKVLESNKEINGLSLGGVGRGTTIEYVEAYAIADDGFEFFGGTVNTRYLVSAFNDDDAFDMDQGHRGKHQFWFGIQEPGARDNGFELNGEPVGLVFTNTPLGKFNIYNATVIGAGSSSGVANNGFNVRDRASPNLRNSVFTEFGQRGLNVSANCQPLIDSSDLTFKNTFWWNFGNVANPNSVTNLAIANSAQWFFTNSAFVNLIVDPQLRSISRSQNGGLDPRPASTSPVFTNYTTAPNDGFFTTANYAGAFGTVNWAADWTALGAYGIFNGAGAGSPAETVISTPQITTGPATQSIFEGNHLTLTVDASGGGLSYQWYKNGKAISGATSSSYSVSGIVGNPGGSMTGPSTTQVPFMESAPTGTNFAFMSLLSAADSVNGYQMVGVPDGLGAFDNGNGTFTLLMNHEIVNTSGTNRAHGGKGAFVSRWVIDKTSLAVLSGQDLANTLYMWNGSSYVVSNYSISRLCSADLPATTAFYNAGLGTTNRIFMDGEEGGNNKAFAWVATGPDAGKGWELPWLGKLSWENALASPYAQNKTIIIGTDDDGLTDSQVYVYIGTKNSTGTLDIEKAGLTNGSLYGVVVAGMALESNTTAAITRSFTLTNLSALTNVTLASNQNLEDLGNTAGVTAFMRCEDGVWDPVHPTDFYFVTTASITLNSRLWRLRFSDITNPELGGTIDMLLDGTEGQLMMDNLTYYGDGQLIIQEDPGNNSRLARVWCYDIATDKLTEIGRHKNEYFTTGQPKFLTQDEESSGVIDISSILGYPAMLMSDQIHVTNGIAGSATTITNVIVENGQLTLVFEVGDGDYTVVVSNSSGSVTSQVATVNVLVPPGFNQPVQALTPSISESNSLSVTPFGTGPFVYQWMLNGTNINGATSATYTIPGATLTTAGLYQVKVTGAGGSTTFDVAEVTVTELKLYPGVALGGPVGTGYSIQYTTNLAAPISWNTLTNITLTVTPSLFYDSTPSTGSAQRFYRAIPAE